ncbi:putative aBC transporter permease protein [Mycobacterium ulcerans str. Harvey]|uniref:ABC transporter permease protein n=1 Tax=Mycobacterium ulcerans str. Harvey TaxID=1299332 RepID=A0ABN0R0F1_MYCUL|nr:putative aBC transporter permease protein [Mycobacterium ulcerans str. Harvey]
MPRMLAAQFGLELKLLLRNGEQLLLTMFIPITLLIGLTLLPLGSFGQHRAATFVPVIMALAVISTAFTGQAIAVAFDRRYGALKRLGATPLPVWGSSPASRWPSSPWCSCRQSCWAPSASPWAGARRWPRWRWVAR